MVLSLDLRYRLNEIHGGAHIYFKHIENGEDALAFGEGSDQPIL